MIYDFTIASVYELRMSMNFELGNSNWFLVFVLGMGNRFWETLNQHKFIHLDLFYSPHSDNRVQKCF